MSKGVLVVERSAVRQARIREAIEKLTDLEVTGAGSSISAALSNPNCLPEEIEYLVINTSLSQYERAETWATIRTVLPSDTSIISLAPPSNERLIVTLAGIGAKSILDPNASPARIVKAILNVREGRLVYGKEHLQQLKALIMDQEMIGEEELSYISYDPSTRTLQMGDEEIGLTSRESEVLILLAEAFTNRQIALDLSISPRTAAFHVSNILRKLKVDSRVQAAIIGHIVRERRLEENG